MGETPLFLYERASKYIKADKKGYIDFDTEKIREDFSIPIEKISVASFVKHKILSIVEDVRHRWGMVDY